MANPSNAAAAGRPPNPDDDIQGPAVTRGYVQDRVISNVAGEEPGWRRLDGLAYLRKRKLIGGHQEDAGLKLQEDYEVSQMRAMPRSGSGLSGRGPRDIPQSAIDARDRYEAALACIPPELLTMTVLYLLPSESEQEEERFFSFEEIAKRVREDKRAIPLGVRAALSILARHYGYCT